MLESGVRRRVSVQKAAGGRGREWGEESLRAMARTEGERWCLISCLIQTPHHTSLDHTTLHDALCQHDVDAAETMEACRT